MCNHLLQEKPRKGYWVLVWEFLAQMKHIQLGEPTKGIQLNIYSIYVNCPSSPPICVNIHRCLTFYSPAERFSSLTIVNPNLTWLNRAAFTLSEAKSGAIGVGRIFVPKFLKVQDHSNNGSLTGFIVYYGHLISPFFPLLIIIQQVHYKTPNIYPTCFP
jgi:hypothetical protein